MGKNQYAKVLLQKRREHDTVRNMITMQYAQDAACIAANEVLGMGQGRAGAFCARFCAIMTEIATMATEDAKSDKEFEYTKFRVDERIRAIVGDENFQPWEVRYGIN